MSDWLDIVKEWGIEERASLDVRSREAFAEKRVVNSRNVPFEEVKTRLMELPLRDEPLLIFGGSKAETEAVVEFFSSRNFVHAQIISTGEEGFWEEMSALNWVVSGPEDLSSLPPMLFHPSQTLLDWTETIERELEALGLEKKSIDIACGSGRDVVFLARRGWHVSGMDEFGKALGRVETFAREHRVIERVRTFHCKIRTDGSLEGEDGFMQSTYNLVVVVRFLQRQFLPTIANLVAPGGFILYETFAEEGAEVQPTGHKAVPKAGRLLSTDDLFKHFPEKDFTVFHCKLRTLQDERRLRCFVAQRKPIDSVYNA